MTTAHVGVLYAATKQDRYVEEAFLSAESVKRFAPDLPITLFTDRPDHPLCALGVFDRVEILAPVTGFASAWAEGQLGRINALGRTPYRLTLHLDTDTRVYTPQIASLFDRLGENELAMVEEAVDVSVSRAETGRRMFNGGFILYEKNPRVLRWLEAWAARVRRNFGFALLSPLPFVEELAHVGDEEARRTLLRIDQVALMEILSPDRNTLGLLFIQFESAWNYRGSTLAYCPPEQVKIAHSDAFKGTTLNDLLDLAFQWDQAGRAGAKILYDYVATRSRPAHRRTGIFAFLQGRARRPEEWATELLRNADLHLMHSQIDRAMELFCRVAPTDAYLPYALAGQARIALRLEKTKAAVAVASEARALLPKSAYVAAIYGAALLADGRLSEAIPLLEEAATRGSAVGAAQLGRAQFEAMNYTESAAAYRRALRLDPRHEIAANNILHALAGAGQYAEIVARTETRLQQRRWHVPALAFRSIALAELGRCDEERRLVDLEGLVSVAQPDTPPGWPTAEAFHAELQRAILRAPSLRREPAGHATRAGWHSGDLSRSDEPSVQALNRMILDVAAARIAAAKGGDHLFDFAAPRTYDLHAWAVVMERDGHQIAHMHARAWFSGVYYIEVPQSVTLEGPSKAGWLRFGRAEERWHRPETQTVERMVCPRSGLLVSFPSYIWHQTIPLATDSRRISYAFDIVPR